jgi:hypothetical protein
MSCPDPCSCGRNQLLRHYSLLPSKFSEKAVIPVKTGGKEVFIYLTIPDSGFRWNDKTGFRRLFTNPRVFPFPYPFSR